MVYLISPNPNFNYVVFVKLKAIGKTKVFVFYLSATSSHTKYTVKSRSASFQNQQARWVAHRTYGKIYLDLFL